WPTGDSLGKPTRRPCLPCLPMPSDPARHHPDRPRAASYDPPPADRARGSRGPGDLPQQALPADIQRRHRLHPHRRRAPPPPPPPGGPHLPTPPSKDPPLIPDPLTTPPPPKTPPTQRPPPHPAPRPAARMKRGQPL